MPFFFAFLLLAPSFVSAAILDLTVGEKSEESVTLATQAKLETADRKFTLTPVGHGLRYKKVVFVKAKVYVGQLFLSRPEGFVKTVEGALGSLATSPAVAMRLTFLRDVDAKALESAFVDAFKENGISTQEGPVAAFLAAVKDGGGAREKKSLVVAGELMGDVETVIYEDAEGKATTVSGGPGFVRQVFSLWLGKPADSGVESFKKDLLR